ncbi:MAG: YARHG domain-containing protein [Treponema sp.]|nr:YARHG domain-containing protein [Treponema sp.]
MKKHLVLGFLFLGPLISVMGNTADISLEELEIRIWLREGGTFKVDVAAKYYNQGEFVIVPMSVRRERYLLKENHSIEGLWNKDEDDVFPRRSFFRWSGWKEWERIGPNTVRPINYHNYFFTGENSRRDEILEDDFYYIPTRWHLLDVEFPENDYLFSFFDYEEGYLSRHEISPFKYARYIYGGHNIWKGNIRKMTIYIAIDDDVLVEDITIGGISINDLKNKVTISLWEGGSLKNEESPLKIAMEDVTPDVLDEIRIFARFFETDDYYNFGPYANEFGDINEGWIWDRALIYENISDFRLFTKRQIRLFINFFYAIHGYRFTNPIYLNYFNSIENFFDKDNTIYTVNPNFSVDVFNEFERKNIDYLVLLEKRLDRGYYEYQRRYARKEP